MKIRSLTKRYTTIGLFALGTAVFAFSSLSQAMNFAQASAPKASLPSTESSTLISPQSQVTGAAEVISNDGATTLAPGSTQTFRDGDTTTVVSSNADGGTSVTKTTASSSHGSANASVNITVTSNSTNANSGSQHTDTGNYSNSQAWNSSSSNISNSGNSQVQIVH